jgi:hypothetical protein
MAELVDAYKSSIRELSEGRERVANEVFMLV